MVKRQRGEFLVARHGTELGGRCSSGIMTFIVSHHGTVYETDLGPETESAVKEIDTFNPDSSWKKSEVE